MWVSGRSDQQLPGEVGVLETVSIIVRAYQMPKHCAAVSNIIRKYNCNSGKRSRQQQFYLYCDDDGEVNSRNMVFVFYCDLPRMCTYSVFNCRMKSPHGLVKVDAQPFCWTVLRYSESNIQNCNLSEWSSLFFGSLHVQRRNETLSVETLKDTCMICLNCKSFVSVSVKLRNTWLFSVWKGLRHGQYKTGEMMTAILTYK